MPKYRIAIHLEGGSRAEILEESPNLTSIEQRINHQIREPDSRFRIQYMQSSVIDVEKARVVGWSIDQED
jgi:hypothetical protein